MFAVVLSLRSIVLHPNIPVPHISRLLIRLHVTRSRMSQLARALRQLAMHLHEVMSDLRC